MIAQLLTYLIDLLAAVLQQLLCQFYFDVSDVFDKLYPCLFLENPAQVGRIQIYMLRYLAQGKVPAAVLFDIFKGGVDDIACPGRLLFIDCGSGPCNQVAVPPANLLNGLFFEQFPVKMDRLSVKLLGKDVHLVNNP